MCSLSNCANTSNASRQFSLTVQAHCTTAAYFVPFRSNGCSVSQVASFDSHKCGYAISMRLCTNGEHANLIFLVSPKINRKKKKKINKWKPSFFPSIKCYPLQSIIGKYGRSHIKKLYNHVAQGVSNTLCILLLTLLILKNNNRKWKLVLYALTGTVEQQRQTKHKLTRQTKHKPNRLGRRVPTSSGFSSTSCPKAWRRCWAAVKIIHTSLFLGLNTITQCLFGLRTSYLQCTWIRAVFSPPTKVFPPVAQIFQEEQRSTFS